LRGYPVFVAGVRSKGFSFSVTGLGLTFAFAV